MKCNLLLHCGARAVERTALGSVVTPAATLSWQPIPHLHLVEHVELALKVGQLKIINQAHCLSQDRLRYFGLMQVYKNRNKSDCAWVLGLRNSHDKAFPAGMVAGTQVFVCDNLAFGGEIKFARRHTRFILHELPLITMQAVALLIEKWQTQERRTRVYKNRLLYDREAHDLLVKALLVGVIGPRRVRPVLNQWRNPAHRAFAERTVWSLFNAFTETLKGDNLMYLPKRTEALYLLFDRHVGIANGGLTASERALAMRQ